jgi:hypothetical protein
VPDQGRLPVPACSPLWRHCSWQQASLVSAALGSVAILEVALVRVLTFGDLRADNRGDQYPKEDAEHTSPEVPDSLTTREILLSRRATPG